MSAFVHTGIYGAFNAADPTTLRYYVAKYISDNFTLHEYITVGGQVSKSGELVVRAEYLSIIKSKTN